MVSQTRLPTWRELNRDTSPEAEELLLSLWREAPAWRKVAFMTQLSHSARQLASAGLRLRRPGASPEELRRRLADLLLEPELVRRTYEALPAAGGTPDVVEPDAIHTILLVTDLLDRLEIPYVIGGSFASTVHGLVRTTMDVDLVADLDQEHVSSFVDALQAQFYLDEQSIQDAIQRRGSFNLIHLATMFKVDIFIPKARPFDQQQLARRVAVEVLAEAGTTLWVLSPEDVILAKLDWFRLGGELSERQWRDILGVAKIQGTMLDIVYLKQWAQELDVADLLERVLDETSLNLPPPP